MFKKIKTNKEGSSIIELIIVTVLFAILVPSSLGIFLGGLRISGQGHIQHSAAIALGETGDTIRFMRANGYNSLMSEDEEVAGTANFYLDRAQNGHWLEKGIAPQGELFIREVVIELAYRHNTTNDVCTDYYTNPDPDCVEDPNTRRVTVRILWSPDYIPQEILTQIFYITNWQDDSIFYTNT